MAKVRFKLRRYIGNTKDLLVQLVYRMDGAKNELVFGVDIHVPEKHWNVKERRVRTIKGFPEYHEYNNILDRWESCFNQVWISFQKDGHSPTKEELKESLIAAFKGEKVDSKRIYLLDYFDKFIDDKTRTKITKSTIKQYRNALNHLISYIAKKHKGKKLELKGLDKSFLSGFISYLANDIGHHDNTVNKTIKRLRAVLNEAHRDGLIETKFYEHRDCQVSYVKQPKFYLNEEEIQRIIALDLSNNERLYKVRDKFLIGVWTGLRISDLSALNFKEHIVHDGNGIFFNKLNQKTKKFTPIPLKQSVLAIIDKYDVSLPIISDQKFNKYLKELCQQADINGKVSRVEDGRQKTYEKWELVSSHICRRSFATNAFKAVIHPKYIMPITGHTTVKQFYDYVCIDENEIAETISKHPFFA